MIELHILLAVECSEAFSERVQALVVRLNGVFF
jgi:hypothetical protein